MTWGVTFIGQRGQFEIGLKGSLCVGISTWLLEARVRSVICTSFMVSPRASCWRVMVVTSRRVSWTATTTCSQTVSLVTASVRR